MDSLTLAKLAVIKSLQDHVPNEKPNPQSDVAKHLVLNSNLKINFDSPEIFWSQQQPEKTANQRKLIHSKNLTTSKPRRSIETNFSV